jgi:outer membrane protein assembly factor BamB
MNRSYLRTASLAKLGVGAGVTLLALSLSAVAQTGKATKARPGAAASSARPRGSASDPAELEAQKGEWSRWRGPNGDAISHEKGLLTEWPEQGPPLLWRTKGLGSGFASIAIQNGKLYTQGNKGENRLLGRNVEDGSEVWEATFGKDDPNGTPTCDGEHIYAVSRNGVIACVNAADGKVVWTRDFQKDFGGSVPGWGFSESPLVDGDRIICTPGSNQALLAALNKQTGETIWTTSLDKDPEGGHGGAGYSSIVISRGGGVKQYVTLVGRGVVGVDARNGKLLWGYNKIANGTANIPTPIVKDDYVFCSSGYGDGGTALLKLSKQGAGVKADEVYHFPANKMQNHHGGMILVGRHVYMGHGHNNGFPLSVDMLTGKDAWRPGRGPGQESAAIAYADGHLYFRYQDGTIALIEATPKEYRLKSKFKMATRNGESWPHPVIAGGKLYLRDQDELLCYDLRKQ